MSDVQSRPYYRAIFTACASLFVFAVAYCVGCVRHGWWYPDQPRSGNDFTAFYSAGEQARLGNNIYEWKSTSTPRRPYGYPPMFAVFPMLPLAYLSHNAALSVFHALNILMLAAVFFLLRRLLWPPLASYENAAPFWTLPLTGLLATLALTWRYIHSNTFVGNANLVILFLLTLALYWDMTAASASGSARSKSGIASGLAVALAAAVKVTPGLFGIYFFWSWRRWSMLGGALGLALFLLLIPGVFLGWNTNLNYLKAFGQFVAGKTVGAEQPESDDPGRIVIGRPHQLDPNDSDLAQGVGVSFRGVLTNLLTPAPALKASAGNRPRTVNVANLDPRQVSLYSNILALILLLATVALTYGARSKTGTLSAAVSWSLVTVAMTLISPLTRIAHLVVLAIPIATLVTLLQQKKLAGSARVLAMGALVLVAASGLASDYLRAIGFTTLSLLVVYAALAAALFNLKVGQTFLSAGDSAGRQDFLHHLL